MDKDKLILKLEEYIVFLGEAISRNAGYLYAHGIETPQELVDKGIKYREEIKKLKEELGSSI